jgi:hypothetical protein
MKVDSRSFPESIYTWLGRPSKAVVVLESECHRRECNSVSFLSVIPKQQNRTDVSIA